MLTIFTTPKPFEGHTGVIQQNAIKSWTLLEPRPEIILFGGEEGEENVSRELGLIRGGGLARDEYGTPLLDDLFKKAQAQASHRLLCYVNADIILLSDFMAMLARAGGFSGLAVVVARRWDADITKPLEFHRPDWESRLRDHVSQHGKLSIGGIDYFVFPKGFYDRVPPFAIGRDYWDDWLCWDARKKGARLFDATSVTMAIHQNHFDPSARGGRPEREREVEQNWKLNGGSRYFFRRSLPTHKFTSSGARRPRFFDYFMHIYYRILPRVVSRTFRIRRRLGLYRWWK